MKGNQAAAGELLDPAGMMVVLAQQAGGTMPVQGRVVGGSLISISGTRTAMVVGAVVQAVTD